MTSSWLGGTFEQWDYYYYVYYYPHHRHYYYFLDLGNLDLDGLKLFMLFDKCVSQKIILKLM